MDINLVRELVSIMNKNCLTEIEIREEGVTIKLKKGGDKADKEIVTIQSPMAMPMAGAMMPLGQAGPSAPGTETAPTADSGNEIPSPMVGTFYRSPGPDAEPFIGVGDTVEAETVIGIIEAMKIMNEIPAGRAGVIREFLVVDHEPVEFGQPLAIIEPA